MVSDDEASSWKEIRTKSSHWGENKVLLGIKFYSKDENRCDNDRRDNTRSKNQGSTSREEKNNNSSNRTRINITENNNNNNSSNPTRINKRENNNTLTRPEESIAKKEGEDDGEWGNDVSGEEDHSFTQN